MVLFVQLVSLNVAINSRSNALLTLLISNNFVELKATVFKKLDESNLFQISCSDAIERFQLALFLSLILLQDVTSWAELRMFAPTALGVFACEVGVDWVKHCFVTKFNRLPMETYAKFNEAVCYDYVNSREKLAKILDPTHNINRRLGFASIPLTCVVIRFVMIRLDGDGSLSPANWGTERWVQLALVVLCAGACKILTTLCLLGYSATTRAAALAADVK